MNHTADYAPALLAIANSCQSLIRALEAARTLRLPSWCIGAGAVRNCVWDHLHGFQTPQSLEEVDLVYFDPEAHPEQDAVLELRLSSIYPSTRWDVSNQAHVHLWYEATFGTAVDRLDSLESGIKTWPEFATCVGLSLRDDGAITIVAPYGLNDLFNLRVLHNPLRASVAAFTARHSEKRWHERWPNLSISMPNENAA
jgi:hypothetical protein